jgi:hypothetical protein
VNFSILNLNYTLQFLLNSSVHHREITRLATHHSTIPKRVTKFQRLNAIVITVQGVIMAVSCESSWRISGISNFFNQQKPNQFQFHLGPTKRCRHHLSSSNSSHQISNSSNNKAKDHPALSLKSSGNATCKQLRCSSKKNKTFSSIT